VVVAVGGVFVVCSGLREFQPPMLPPVECRSGPDHGLG